MDLVATLLTDVPLDERTFHGVLLACSRSSLAGAISQFGLEAVHSFGDAERDADARDLRVRCRPANTAPKAALIELRKHGFQPVTALEFEAPADAESHEDAWTLVGLYVEELRGWVVTRHLDFEEARERLGTDEGLLHAPLGGRRRGVLLSTRAMALLSGGR